MRDLRPLVAWCNAWGAAGATAACVAVALTMPLGANTPRDAASAAALLQAFPSSEDVGAYRANVERIFMRDRGGTTPGYAACVMCHTWQTSLRFSLETPAADDGWTAAESHRNFDVVTKLVNTAQPEASRLMTPATCPPEFIHSDRLE